MFENSILLKLDGKKLSNKFSGRPVQYWSGMIKQGRLGDQGSEQEERLYHNKQFIDNANEFITEIRILIGNDVKNDYKLSSLYRKIYINSSKLGIKIKWYFKPKKKSLMDIIMMTPEDQAKAQEYNQNINKISQYFIMGSEKFQINPKELLTLKNIDKNNYDSNAIRRGEEEKVRRGLKSEYDVRNKDIDLLSELVFKSKKDDISYHGRRLIDKYINDLKNILKNILHNSRSSESDTGKLLKIYQHTKARDYTSLITWLKNKWNLREKFVAEKVYPLQKVIDVKGNTCCYCKETVIYPPIGSGWDATREHVIPRSEGGTDGLVNLEIACKACNNTRGSSDLDIFFKKIDGKQRNKKGYWILDTQTIKNQKGIIKNKLFDLVGKRNPFDFEFIKTLPKDTLEQYKDIATQYVEYFAPHKKIVFKKFISSVMTESFFQQINKLPYKEKIVDEKLLYKNTHPSSLIRYLKNSKYKEIRGLIIDDSYYTWDASLYLHGDIANHFHQDESYIDKRFNIGYHNDIPVIDIEINEYNINVIKKLILSTKFYIYLTGAGELTGEEFFNLYGME
jgi:5-methylcytosine-specific restriction endonuclease McrA